MRYENRSFSSTLKDGSVGENLIIAFLKHCGFAVEDKTDDEEYQERDIDILFKNPNGPWKSMEIKSDNVMNRSGNIVVEESFDRKIGRTLGWFHYCEADVLCFCDVNEYSYYFLNWKGIKEKIQDGYWKLSKFYNEIDDCLGRLYKIPIKDLRRLGLIEAEGKVYFG